MAACRLHSGGTSEKARMFKYAARHWAHYRCWLFSKLPGLPKPFSKEAVVALISNLHAWQIEEFPILAVQEALHRYGLLSQSDDAIVVVRAALRMAKERES